MANYALLHLFAALFLAHGAFSVNTYKVCVTPRRANPSLCAALTKGNSQVSCAYMSDAAECARRLKDGSVDFTVLTAEEMILASNFVDDNVRVLGEVRHTDRINKPFAFESVAVVKADFNGLLSSLKGKNFCHPGFAESQLWTDRVLKYFERKVVSQSCDRSRSLVEDEISSLANFFNSSCRPGSWVLNDWWDDKLKQRYPQLCSLCDHKTGCSYNQQKFGSHEAALNCLTQGGGDVTYVAMQYVQKYFGLKDFNQYKPQANVDQYRLLCPNGTIQMLNNNMDPCTWIRQPWPAVVARKDIAVELRPLLKNWLSVTTRSQGSWQDYLVEIVLGRSQILYDLTIPNDLSMINFIKRGREDALESPSQALTPRCRPDVKWCVISDLEQEKCEWMRRGAYSYGLEPVIECVREHSSMDCLEAIQKGRADVVGIDTDSSSIARQSFGLRPVIYQDTSNDRTFSILAVVRANSDIKTLKELKKKSACFPEFGSLAWTAWVDAARSLKILPRKCPSATAVGDFFHKACVPGANDPTHNPHVPAKQPLCSLCPEASKCEANGTANDYYGSAGAMECLKDGQGDVAFVDLRAISKVNANGLVELLPEYRNDEYRVICRNGSASRVPGLLVDANCALASGVGGEVVSNAQDPIAKDIAFLLLDLDNWFGHGSRNYESAFNMFGDFKNLAGVLFRPSVVGFVSVYDRENKYASDFAGLVERNLGCNIDGNGAAGLSAPASAAMLLAMGAIMAFVCRSA